MKTVQNSADFRGVRHAKRVAVFFEKQPNPPLSQTKQHILRCAFLLVERGAIRLIAQGCTCASCPSVSTERWFDTQSVRLFFLKNSLIHPFHIQKSTSCDVLFCWWRGCDSFNSAGLHLCKLPKRQHRKVVRHAKRVAVFSKQPNPPLFAYKTAHLAMCCFAGGEGWIRTTEVTDNRFTVCSLWPLGNLSVWSW